jgi:hypothetical protein
MKYVILLVLLGFSVFVFWLGYNALGYFAFGSVAIITFFYVRDSSKMSLFHDLLSPHSSDIVSTMGTARYCELLRKKGEISVGELIKLYEKIRSNPQEYEVFVNERIISQFERTHDVGLLNVDTLPLGTRALQYFCDSVGRFPSRVQQIKSAVIVIKKTHPVVEQSPG